jgi:hypothetical protein
LKNIVTTDFVKGLVDELNLDVDEEDLNGIVNQVQGDKKDDTEEKKPDEEKKD